MNIYTDENGRLNEAGQRFLDTWLAETQYEPGRIIGSWFPNQYATAKKYGISVMEINLICCEGALVALRTWDDSRGTFATHAAWSMRSRMANAIRRAIRDKKVRLFGDVPNAVKWRNAPHEGAPDDELRLRFLKAIRLVVPSERNREIVTRYYGLDGTGVRRTGSELAAVYGVSKDRICTICEVAFRHLQEHFLPHAEEFSFWESKEANNDHPQPTRRLHQDLHRPDGATVGPEGR